MEQEAIVLVVDDHPDGRKILQSLLNHHGYRVIVAANGLEALSLAATHSPDIILLDIMMPDIDGYEVCRRLRADPALAEVPVVMVTALHDREARLQGIEAGADDFLVKPFDPVELTTRVRSIARLNRYRRLMAERAKLNWVVDQAEDAYLEIGRDGRICYANGQAGRYLNLSLNGRMPERPWLELMREQYNCQPEEAWTDWPEQNLDPSPRYLVRPDSQHAEALWLQVETIESLSSAGGSYFIRLRDVTAEVNVQRNRWTFHAQVSHKLRTPLGLLSGYIEMLSSRVDQLELAEMEKMLFQKVFSSSRRLQDEILGIFRYMETSEISPSGRGPCPVSRIAALVEKIGNDFDLPAVEIRDNTLGEVTAVHLPLSERALELILWELLENARRFHPEEKPAVTVEIAQTNSAGKGAIQLRVTDDGIHLPSEELTKTWQPYYQVERYFTGQVAGMGLGLAMVATLVWEVGGQYQMTNREDGPGVVVELIFPQIIE
jgi:CheY-like chemotaxis protein/anti-sigma regulatory factor (Ser/Thr protein kinase)